MAEVVRARLMPITGASILGALAAIMVFLPLDYPFPILGHLRFDLAEIPSMIAFLLFGPAAGFFVAIVHWIGLNIEGIFIPIGPLMKLCAVTSTLIGLWVGVELYARVIRGRSVVGAFTYGAAMGIIVRVLVMTVANFIVLAILFPGFLVGIAKALGALGFAFAEPAEAIGVTLAFTAAFNSLHVFLSTVPAYAIVKASFPLISKGLKKTWITEVVRRT